MDGEQWLLPHHPIINSHRPLPRVVFDSAAKHDGVCLNDCLEKGPSLHNDLPSILLRFGEKLFALVGDMSDMFCHVLVKEEDRKYHRYLWRDMDSTRPPDVYEMNWLVLGDKSSPCEANFAVIRTTEDNQNQWPEAAAAVRRDIFVDDFYSSRNDVPQAVSLRADVSSLMAKGGFPMRKWVSSSPEVLATIPETERTISNKNLQQGTHLGRALGVWLDAQSDTLGLTYPHVESPSTQSTKRCILAKLAGLYDPRGWSSPFTVRAQITLKRTWSKGLDWNEPLPADIASEWVKWESEVAVLRYIYSLSSETLTRELVVFCDASEDACAAVAYTRAVLVDGEVICHLVMAKTHLMSLKTISIPRGELMGCQLAVPSRKNGYDLNVANIATRGVAANDRKPESRWINGQDILKSDKSALPIDDNSGPPSPTAQWVEIKKKVLGAKVVVPKLLDPAGYSNWLKLVRVTAWILQFCHGLRKKDQRNAEVLSVEELEEGDLYWIKSAQQDRF
ncbi:Hypothetical predicted protein [Paramuricea clavata]|uniref:Uncharacterized protein n=1 Tax=Paramuricea clavata TaxID=317549 RepID=A0A7D9IZG8_PARCT|nr:Hypothetical predicted protein [Paramuricea clavata]